MIADGKLKGTTTTKEVIPDFQGETRDVTEMTNIIDLLAHRTCLTGLFQLTSHADGFHLVQVKNVLGTFPIWRLQTRSENNGLHPPVLLRHY